MKHPIKTRLYNFFTRVYHWNIPILEQGADIIRDWCYNEDMYE